MPAARTLLFYFCRRIPRVILLVFVLVSAAIDDKSRFKFKWLWLQAIIGQGHHSGIRPRRRHPFPLKRADNVEADNVALRRLKVREMIAQLPGACVGPVS
ncbi:hypothetical protein [Bradyrhizobium sp. SZCCHNR2009]|uniref:hypothetical protein n=1 Tax=Bradyrhizobium sp. SZCCHNR2009 TaxID=3057375 RepID=UPI0028E6ED41|nr:hypothetical protein [Bradyrhizobium sp. SZCCHNR2009]